MSTDLHITRPTSRVMRPPGGASSNIFGTYEHNCIVTITTAKLMNIISTGSEPSVPTPKGVIGSPVTSKNKSFAQSPVKPPAPPEPG
jgi:hypothetical protein